MSIFHSLFGAGLANSAVLPTLRKLVVRGRPMVLMYHELARDTVDVDAWAVLKESDFLQQVDYLRRHYRIVSLDELMIRPRSEDHSRPSVALTFDDGNVGNFEVLLPLVERLELPVAIFIATGHIESQCLYWFDRIVNALQVRTPIMLDLRQYGLGSYRIGQARGASNWNRIQQLLTDIKQLSTERAVEVASLVEAAVEQSRDAGYGSILPMTVDQAVALGKSPFVTIGAHSHGHPLLTQVSIDDARKSIEKSRELLRAWTGQPIHYFAYPSGAHDDRVVRLIEELGFRAAFTTQERFWNVSDSPFRIPRMGVGRYDTLDQFKLNLIGGVRSLAGELRQGFRKQRDAASAYA